MARHASTTRILSAAKRLFFLAASVIASLSLRFNAADAANVSWSVGDSVAACPSGDTLSTTVTRPSRLRVAIQYLDAALDPRVGVPPESLYVTLVTVSGNIKANDKATFTYADDSTNSEGKAWITLPSLSGCGRLQVFLTVSNATQGGRSATVRTTDHNADGRVDSADLGPGAQCDLNYSGSANATDLSLVVGHNLHWRRLALHGTLVRRTNLCDNCIGNSPNTYGEGRSFWSPNGRWISYTIHDPNLVDVCNAYILPSDPKDGNVPRKITFATTRPGSVYDPTWSPLGHELVYELFGIGLYRKGIVGLAADTSETLIVAPSGNDRVVYPVFSPDADSIAFTYLTDTSPTTNDINTIAVSGGAKRNLTFNNPDNFDDRYPSWACDGSILIVDRAVVAQSSRRRIYKVPITADDAPDAALFYQPPTPQSARVPYYSPDSLVIVAAVGTTATQTALTTFETSQPSGLVKAIRSNYPGYFDVNLYAVPSPDGTRLLMAARDPRISGAQSARCSLPAGT